MDSSSVRAAARLWGAACAASLIASACSDPRGRPDAGTGPGGAGRNGAGDAGDLGNAPDGQVVVSNPERPLGPAGPSTCALPGDPNEFHLPVCEVDAGMDAGRPSFDCEVGFDEFGRPVCVDDAGVPQGPPPPDCRRGGLCRQITVANNGRLDLLFLVDSSGSMREEQQALVAQMPNLIRVLTSGDLEGDGTQDFPPVRDLHVGVISSNLGLPGVQGIPGCSGLGDNGALRNAPSTTVLGCAASYPTFLSFEAPLGDADQLVNDFACIATLGTLGCGYEQQLESMLKAVTPSSSDRRFVIDPLVGGTGLGQADGPNAGFLREDSLVALVMVTDEDDCSARETRLFTPDIYLDATDPLRAHPINLRCHFNPRQLFPLARYATGLREIRPPGSGLVLFAAIVGVPVELVDAQATAGVDFTDPAARDAFYEGLLGADAMQERVQGGTDNLTPSCSTPTGLAYPPRRIVEVARSFGEDAVVQSICQSSFAPAVTPIVERISRSLAAGCLSRSLARGADGRVACDLVWELPAVGTPGASLLTCADAPVLSDHPDPDYRTSRDGRPRCVVNQLPVTEEGSVPSGSGWYYDQGSDEASQRCGASGSQRVVFTSDVNAPYDVRVYIDCEAQP